LQSVAIEARRQACLIEKEICCPHGQIIWITAVPFGDDHYVNFYGRDITERKQAEERFRLLIEAAPNAMLMVDQAGKIELVNIQVEKLLGYSRDELLGQSVEFLVPERFRAAYPGQRARFFAEPSARAMGAGRDLYGLGKDGREIPVEIGLNPIRINERPFVLASIIDITERKRVEQMLRDLNAELERRVATRTAELEVEVTERRRAEEVMRLALEEKKTLLEEIHHRVKNNLQIISSLLRLQGGYVKNEEDRARFDECQNRLRTMAMVHERLYRSQNLASINFGEHVRDLANMLASTYSQAAVRVQVFAEAESAPLKLETAIPAGLIVNELVSNALKHAFPAGRRGTLKVGLHSPAPGQLLLSVEDDGVGLPPGFDWDQARSLGFRMVHDLTRQIRGTLEVRQSGGTTFALSFPVPKPQPDPSPQP
jgi:PAS domain S-box-containing protein